MENEKLMPEANETANAYIVSSDKKIPGRIPALISMIMAIISASSVVTVGFLSFVIIVLTFLSYVVLLPLMIPTLCFIPLLFAIAAVVLAKIAKKKGNNTNNVKVGFVLGIISTIFWGVVNVLLVALMIFLIILIVVVVILATVFGVLGAVVTGVFGALVTGATAIVGVLGPIVTIFTPVLAIIAGIITTLGGDAVSEIIAYLYEFLFELFNTYVINGAALIRWII